MANFYRAIKVHSSVYRGEREMTILTSTITAIAHDGDTERAVVHTTGSQSFRVAETYDEVLAMYEKIA